MTDQVALARAVGTAWPLDQAGVESFASTLLGNGEVLVPESALLFRDDQAWRDELGFGAADITAVAETGVPPSVISVYRTTVEPGAIATAVEADPGWSTELVSAEKGDATVYTWGDDPLRADVSRTSPARPLGQGGVMAVVGDDGLVLRSTDPDQVDAALAARGGDGPTLADDAGFAGIAAALDGEGCYHALLSGRPPVLDPFSLAGVTASPAALKELEEKLTSEPALPPYRAVGIGEAVDGGGQGYMVFAFATGSDDEAGVLADAFTQVVATGTSFSRNRPWSEEMTVRHATTDGSIAVITVDTDDVSLGFGAFVRNDTLLASRVPASD